VVAVVCRREDVVGEEDEEDEVLDGERNVDFSLRLQYRHSKDPYVGDVNAMVRPRRRRLVSGKEIGSLSWGVEVDADADVETEVLLTGAICVVTASSLFLP